MSYPLSSTMNVLRTNALRAGASLALVALLAAPALATVPVSPGVNLVQLQAQLNALQATVNSDHATITALQTTVNNQAATIKALQTLTSPLSLNGTPGTFPATLTISGVNVQIVNGLGATNGEPNSPFDTFTPIENGLGNLIVGYNESRLLALGTSPDIRTGSHNLILGFENNYSSYGGFIGGRFNTISAPGASVISGTSNLASGVLSVVATGQINTASGVFSVVTGGQDNTASSLNAVATGGNSNTASGDSSEVTGGFGNTASTTNSIAP